MSGQPVSYRLIVYLLLDMLLIVFGTALLIGAGKTFDSGIWLPLAITLAGIFILSPDASNNTIIAIILIGLGCYLLSRELGIIATPWIRYLLAGFSILTGALNILRNATGKEVALSGTYSRTKSDKQAIEE